ncbi:hypothetical protein E3P78_00442 [Wallemia ichthyophaga]|nr:hypothetical protein E3P78_00442 [Wallemia ichthyophaga]
MQFYESTPATGHPQLSPTASNNSNNSPKNHVIRHNLPTPPPSHSASPAPLDRQKCVYESLPNLYHGSTESQLAKQIKLLESHKDFAEENPFFVADISSVYKQQIRWKNELPRIEPFFAVKCNPDPYVIRLLAALGLGFDCASQAEINTILSLPTSCPATEDPSNNIIFANPCKAASMVKFARRNQVKMMTFDNTDELHKIAKLYPSAQLVIRILTDDSKSVCRFGIKFGAPLDAVPHLLKTAKDLSLNVIGVSFHVGSGCYDPQSYVDAIQRSKKTFEVGESLGYKFNLLDVGGGFGHDNFELLARSLGPAVDEYFPAETGVRVIAEPGRFYVHDAFSLATNIIAKRGSADDIDEDMDDQSPKVMYYQNDGVYGAFNCVMFDHAEPKARPLTVQSQLVLEDVQLNERKVDSEEISCSIWGPTCDSLDCVMKSHKLAKGLQVGDWLRWDEMGAYTICAASTFNGFSRADVHYTSGADSMEAQEVRRILQQTAPDLQGLIMYP